MVWPNPTVDGWFYMEVKDEKEGEERGSLSLDARNNGQPLPAEQRGVSLVDCARRFRGLCRRSGSSDFNGDTVQDIKISLFTIGGRLIWQKGVELKLNPKDGKDNITTLIACQAPAAGTWFVCIDDECAKIVSLK